MDSDTKVPSIEDLKSAGIPDPEYINEIHMKARKAYSKSLETQKGTIWLTNGYSLKPDAIELGFRLYEEMIWKKADGRIPHLLENVKEELKQNLAKWIGSDRPQDISCGVCYTNFLMQILSCFWGKPVRILTTDEEFYATTRIANRLREIDGNVIKEVPLFPLEDFNKRFYEEACKEKYDLVIISHVFFKCGVVLDDLDELILKLKTKVGRIIIDGGGSFGNVSTSKSLGHVMDDIYYIGGTFKFIGAGEGFTFMSLPKGCQDRPVFTGWLFGDISEKQYYSLPVEYPEGGDKYSHSTTEMSIWVRVNEVMKYFDKEMFTVEMKNQYTRTLQDCFIRQLNEKKISFLSEKNLVTNVNGKWRALQLVFEMKDEKISAKEVSVRVARHRIIFDPKGTRLRICLPIYYNIFDMDVVIEKLQELDAELKD